MTLSNIKTMKEERGFTIVELLIVIVVIAILAAIVIVAYNGIQKRANLAAAQSAANTLQKKAEAYNAVKSAYPADSAAFNSVPDSSLTGSGITLSSGTITASNGKTTLKYELCGTTGARISYFDFTASTPAVPTTPQIMLGDATASSTCTAAAS